MAGPATTKTRVLSAADVESLVDMRDAVDAVERAFDAHGRGETQMPPKVYIELPAHDGDFRAMPAAMAGAGTQVFWGFIRIMILLAFYRSATGPAPMSFETIVTYVWLGQAFLALLPWIHDRELEQRPTTGVFVAWSPPDWAKGDAGPGQRTPNLAAVIDSVVNGGGWQSGNALVILISGTGDRVAESFDGDEADAPLLHVEYTVE